MNGADECKIDWDGCHFVEDEKHSEEYHITMLKDDYENLGLEKRPETLHEVGQTLHERKFIGYLDDGYIRALQELCRHLKPAPSREKSFPRLYYEYEGFSTLHYFEFHPGTDVIIWGIYKFDEEEFPGFPGWETMTEEYIKEIRPARFSSLIETAEWRTMRLAVYDWSKESTRKMFEDFFGKKLSY